MNIAALDLNLLKVFAALYEARHVTEAGRAIGLAQPSVSNALARLRHLFGDELFVRTPGGMVPTERAEALAPKIKAALALIGDALEPADIFDPLSAKAEIALAASDNVQLVYGARLAAHLAETAPNFDLRLRTINKDTLYADMDAGRIDAALCRDSAVPARFFSKDVLQDSFVCIARCRHPKMQQGLTAEIFASIPQVLMTLRADDSGVIDTELKKLGLARRVAVTAGQFMAVRDIVAGTDYIATFPASMARQAEAAGCEVHPVPVPVASWTLTLVWSQAANANPAKRFFIDELVRLMTAA